MHNKFMLLVPALLMTTAVAANAKTYHIAISGACDTLTLSDTAGEIVGTSDAGDCDDSFEVGTEATVKSTLAPGGKVLVAAGDLGTAPTQWVWEFNLKTGEAELRGTSDGSSQISAEFSFTTSKSRAPGDRSHLPRATDLVRQKARQAQR